MGPDIVLIGSLWCLDWVLVVSLPACAHDQLSTFIRFLLLVCGFVSFVCVVTFIPPVFCSTMYFCTPPVLLFTDSSVFGCIWVQPVFCFLLYGFFAFLLCCAFRFLYHWFLSLVHPSRVICNIASAVCDTGG